MWSNLSCITDLIDVVNPCTADQSAVIYWLDDNGISLAKASKIADERYTKGQTLVDNKIRIALDDVMSHLMRNTTRTCDLDSATGIICDEAIKVARAVWYRATALIYKELAVDSSRYNEIIQFAGTEALANLIYYDSSFQGFTNLEKVKSGLYQRELDKLEPLRTLIEQTCCVDGTGQTSWRITIP